MARHEASVSFRQVVEQRNPRACRLGLIVAAHAAPRRMAELDWVMQNIAGKDARLSVRAQADCDVARSMTWRRFEA